MNDAPCRLVVLHHTGIDWPHYDLMYERRPGGPLVTWRFPQWPPTQVVRVEPLGDHRRDYLDYEGPVSGNRGQVRRILSGLCRPESVRADRLVLSLDVPGLPVQRLVIEASPQGMWTARPDSS